MRKYDNEMLMEFVKSNNIKTADDLNSAFREMYKDVIQVMLENEMNNHLGYDKGSKTKAVFDSLLKTVYLAKIGVSKKWTVPIRE